MTEGEDEATRVDGDPLDGDGEGADLTAALRRGRPPASPHALAPLAAAMPAEVVAAGASAASERPRRLSVTPLSIGGSRTGENETRASLASAVNAPAAALRVEEIERTRVFLKIAIGTVVCATAAALVAGGDPSAKLVLILSCLLVAVSAGIMLALTRDRAGYTDLRALVVAMLIAAGANGSIYYWGLASPATGLLVYGIYFFALGANRTRSRRTV